MNTIVAPSLKNAAQKVNEWGNTYSGLIAVAGVAVTLLLFARRR